MSGLTKRNAGAYRNTTPANINTKNSDVMGNKPVLDFFSDTTVGTSTMHNDLGSDTGIGGNSPVLRDVNDNGSPGGDIGGFGNPPVGANKRKQGKSDVTNVVR